MILLLDVCGGSIIDVKVREWWVEGIWMGYDAYLRAGIEAYGAEAPCFRI